MNDQPFIHVLLADDHPVVRDGYRRLLEGTGDIRVQAEAANGEEACTKYREGGIDVVVLDLTMPGIGGLEAIHRLRAHDPRARVLVFSIHDNRAMVTRALEAGASGYLTKSSAASEMIAAVRQVARGKRYLSAELAAQVVPALRGESDPLDILTQREFQVFRKLAEGRSVQEIAEVLSISPKTVGVHHTHIMKKLEIRNTAQLTRLAIRYGIIEP